METAIMSAQETEQGKKFRIIIVKNNPYYTKNKIRINALLNKPGVHILSKEEGIDVGLDIDPKNAIIIEISDKVSSKMLRQYIEIAQNCMASRMRLIRRR